MASTFSGRVSSQMQRSTVSTSAVRLGNFPSPKGITFFCEGLSSATAVYGEHPQFLTEIESAQGIARLKSL